MSTAETIRTPSLDLRCGNCSHVNLPEVKFCGGCGHALFESCPGCKESVRLNQRFCGSCGVDLHASFANVRLKKEQALVDALAETKQHRYENAMERLSRLASESDYRLADLVDSAKVAIAKIKDLRDETSKRIAKVFTAVELAVEQDNKPEIQRLLRSVPAAYLDEASTRLLAKTEAYLLERESLQDELKLSVAAKNWPMVGTVLGRLIELSPDDASLKTMAKQVASKLMATSERLFVEQKYSQALDSLDAVPNIFHDETHEGIRQRIQTADWLRQQFDREPYCTAALGRLAVRLSKHAPEDSAGPRLTSEISSKLKQATASPVEPYPYWLGKRQSVLGGEAAILGWPKSVNAKGDANIKKLPARFCVAIGLALQGLGVGKVDDKLGEKKSLLGAMTGRRKPKTVWGVDVGSSCIKAVLLQTDGKEIVVIDSFVADYPPTTRAGVEGNGLLGARDAIKKFVEEKNLAKTEVWANFPSREVLSRFVELPPVDDKKAKTLLDADAAGQFPVNVSELDFIKWYSPKPSIAGIGRPAAIVAATKYKVKQRLDFLAEAGLKVAGLQCDQLALVNFAHHEFEEVIKGEEGSHKFPAVAIVDAGTAATTLLIVDRDGFWFRTMEGGGDDATTAIARSVKVVATEAEKIKRDPSSLPFPASQYQPVEEKQLAMASRLKQVVAEPLRDRRDLKIEQTWAVGGGCFTFGWLRRVLCDQA